MYQTPPSRAGATSWGRDPAGTGNACKSGSEGDSLLGVKSVGRASAVGTGGISEPSRDADVGGSVGARIGFWFGVGDAVGIGVGVEVGVEKGFCVGVGVGINVGVAVRIVGVGVDGIGVGVEVGVEAGACVAQPVPIQPRPVMPMRKSGGSRPVPRTGLYG